MPRGQTSAKWLIAWLAIALAVRLVAAVVVDRIVSATPGRLCLIEGDASGYWELGRRLARGKDYSLYEPPRRILRMPGFPILIAACQLTFGDRVFPVRCVLAVIGTLACGGVYVLGRNLLDDQVGRWALIAVSLSPPLVAFTPLLLTETTFAAALVISLIPLLSLVQSTPHTTASAGLDSRVRWPAACAAGVGLAVAVLIRPTWLPAALVASAAIVIAGRWQRARWLEGAILLLACAVCLAPWTYRNYLVSGHVIPTTLWVGASLYDGLNPQATGDSDMTFFDQENLLATLSEYDVDREYRRRAWAFVREQPGRTLELAVVKGMRYWSPWPNAAQFERPLLQWGLLFSTLPLYLGAVLGVLIHRRDWRVFAFTCLPALFFCAVHLLFVGSIRYRLPADYLLWIAAAAGAQGVVRWWLARDSQTGGTR